MTPAAAASRRPDRHPPGVRNLLASGLAQACHYAAARPGCQVLAAVRYGQLALVRSLRPAALHPRQGHPGRAAARPG
ncbi:MAG TPA: hypothetical protein VMV92_10375 [Streptosporangiaceae bacterium]|nr:hypothetical protein [Streptosporangiaceae bacterium]